ncbi:MAG: VWA domain-containing protein [Kofleriaceae bacterium]
MKPSIAMIVTLAAAAAAACGSYGGSGDFGATVGGVKDLHLARDLIARGQVPPAAALLVEAMFAEHDLGLAGPPCAETLCLRGALGVAPGADGVPRGWLQVGLSSTIDPATYRRPATTFIYTVDVSGSMGWDYGPGSPGELARQLMTGLAPRLTADDRVAIVTFGSSVATALAPTPGDQQAQIAAAIDRLGEGGATNMEAGLVRAYELGRAARAAGGNVRVVLFTDTQPNVGATTPTQFDRLVTDGAAAGVGLTVVALGLGIGPEVLQSIANQRGGNAFSMGTPAEVEQFLADEDPWFAAPIASALRVGVTTGAGVTIDAPYGFPVGFAEDPTFKVESVFLSRRKGALLVSLAGDDLTDLAAELVLGYRDAAGVDHAATIPLARGGAPVDERGQWFGQEATARTTALALVTTAMHDAAAAYEVDRDLAISILAPAVARFEADAAALAADDLPVEVDLAQDLLRLMELGAPQGTLYGR